MTKAETNLQDSKLRSWQDGDAGSLVANANNEKIWDNLRDVFPYPYKKKDAKKWITAAAAENPQTNFAIAVNGKAVGGIGIEVLPDVYRVSAELGYWLGEPFWNKGIMTKSIITITKYAFENFEISRIFAGVFEWNKASMRVLEKAGFEYEARLQKSIIKNGDIGDQYIYSLLK